MASSEIGATPVRSPGWPPRPNELLKYGAVDRHVVHAAVLRRRTSWRREVCGVRRVKSLMRPLHGRQRRQRLAVDRGGRAGARRAEHRVGLRRDRHRFGDRDRA